MIAAAAVRLALNPLLGAKAPLLIFTLPVIASAVSAGPRGGVVATFLGAALGTFLFIPPVGSLVIATTAEGARLTIFITEGLLITWLVTSIASPSSLLSRATYH